MRTFSDLDSDFNSIHLGYRWLRNRAILAELLDVHYTEHHRKYHTTEHIIKCLDLHHTFCSWNAKVDLPFNKELVLAILFHDIVYEVGSKENEKKSAEFALEYGKYFTSDFTDPLDVIHWDKVAEIIMATVHDGKEVPTLAARYMINIDLYTLGSSREDYLASSKAIKFEFMPKYGTLEFVYGRNQFLESMIARPSIFYPVDIPMFDVIFQKMNERAKINMKDEQVRLTRMV